MAEVGSEELPAAPVPADGTDEVDLLEVEIEAVETLADTMPSYDDSVPLTLNSEPAGTEISYEEFGRNYIRAVLPTERLLRTIDRLLGDRISLGPIGAGPGRAFATVSVVGLFRPTTGHEVVGEPLLTYRVDLPVDVTFDVDLRMDRLRFEADLVVPLTIVVHTEAPARIRIEILMPSEDQINLVLASPTRRGGVFGKLTGLEGELRRFLIKVLSTELDKPYVRKATLLDMAVLIDGSWDHLSAQFLPSGPEDRADRRPWPPADDA